MELGRRKLSKKSIPVIDLDGVHVFRPSLWSRIKLVIWMLLPAPMILFGTQWLFVDFLPHPMSILQISSLISFFLLLFFYLCSFCFAVRQTIISYTFKKEIFTRRSIFSETSISYRNLRATRAIASMVPGYRIVLKIWHSKGILFITNFEFSTTQVEEIKHILESRSANSKTLISEN
jgi:hypothetical protein